ncbi:MAG: chromosome partitioning protein ParB [Deltaproteobacteria bacterium SG8_13]|nr:MAG: chromosome partitioning protein ParB [Deltaproteobacteria bacterium SG8_13]
MDRNSISGRKKGKKLALGRGLDALIPGLDSKEPAMKEFFQCDIDLIRRNRHQPRRRFSEDELQELTDSIRAQGIIQPLVVRKQNGEYELVAGERRLRAARKAGLKQVPVIVRAVEDAEMLEMSLVENIQREDLNPMEEADAYHRLIAEFSLTQDQAAKRVGKSRSAVANFLRLRNLPQQIKESITDGSVSMGHARALLSIENTAAQLELWSAVIRKGLSVRETENFAKQAKPTAKSKKSPQPTSEQIYFTDIAADLSRYYGTKVQIKRRGRVGRVEIEFYGDQDLDRLLGMLKLK